MLEIRKARATEAAEIGPLLLLAAGDVLKMITHGQPPLELKAFLTALVAAENNQYSYSNCVVALLNGVPVGALCIYNGALLAKLRYAVLSAAELAYGAAVQPEDETQAGEYYIDSLGVNEHFRGMGIGRQLLQYVIAEYAEKMGHTLGLLVDKKNDGAGRLYESLGFKIVAKKVLAGRSMHHMQLSTAANPSAAGQ